jgi:hypothetical protein
MFESYLPNAISTLYLDVHFGITYIAWPNQDKYFKMDVAMIL